MISIYVLCDGRKPGFFGYDGYGFDYEPFYVGLTRRLKQRVKEHFDSVHLSRGQRLRDSVQAEGFNFEIIWTGNDIQQAVIEEREAIRAIGRQDLGYGPLLNIHGGGQATSFASQSKGQLSRYERQTREKTLRDMQGIRLGLRRYWDSMTPEQRSARGYAIANKRKETGAELIRGLTISSTKRQIAIEAYLNELTYFDHFWLRNVEDALNYRGAQVCDHVCINHGVVSDSRERVMVRIRKEREPCRLCYAESFFRDRPEKKEALQRRQECRSLVFA